MPSSRSSMTDPDNKEAVTSSTTAVAVVDWTPTEERAALRRIDFWVLPLFMLAFYSLQLDRGSISNALTDTLREDLGVNQDIINNGQSILLCMIVAFEIPSNLVMQRIGAKTWLPSQMIAWGLVATLQCLVTNKAGYYATRVFLGIGEAGFIPGAVYYLSTFYRKDEFASRAAWLWVGNLLAKGSSGLLASGILRHAGKGGRAGWQWLFLIEGIVSIAIGCIAMLLLPRSTTDTKTHLGLHVLTERQSHILTTRIIMDDPLQANAEKLVAASIFQWRLWIHVFYILTLVAPVSALSTYNALITKSLGFTKLRANALASVGAWLEIPTTLACGYLVDLTRQRGLIIFLFTLPCLIFASVYYLFQISSHETGVWTRYAVYQVMVAWFGPTYTAALAWSQVNARTPMDRSVHACMIVMSSNAGQAMGGQMFTAADSPKYVKGLGAAIGLFSAACVFCISSIVAYAYSNKHNLGHAGEVEEAEVETDATAEGEAVVRKQWRYRM